ncbi:MAG: magnesium transporter CorA family protein [candidate division Zixibacteria bacterium]|nr:magnesium transporter CorA family protein [candidate division Zixibacteria bacterium]
MRTRYTIVNRKLVAADSDSCEVTMFVNPDEMERKYLLADLKLDEHTLASALDPDEISRMEFEPEHVAVIFKRPKNYSAEEQFLFKVGSVGAYLFKERLVIVTADDSGLIEDIPQIPAFSPGGLILKMIYRSIVHFREHLKIISRISDELQKKINTALENRHLINMFTLQTSLVYYLNSLNSNGALLEKLRNNAAKIGLTTEELEILDDTLIENNQCMKQAQIYSDILAGLMDARASIVSNNLNVLMKTLTIITIAIMTPTLVVSAFSMNVGIPMQHHPYAFWIIMGMALLAMFGFLAFLRIKRW